MSGRIFFWISAIMLSTHGLQGNVGKVHGGFGTEAFPPDLAMPPLQRAFPFDANKPLPPLPTDIATDSAYSSEDEEENVFWYTAVGELPLSQKLRIATDERVTKKQGEAAAKRLSQTLTGGAWEALSTKERQLLNAIAHANRTSESSFVFTTPFPQRTQNIFNPDAPLLPTPESMGEMFKRRMTRPFKPLWKNVLRPTGEALHLFGAHVVAPASISLWHNVVVPGGKLTAQGTWWGIKKGYHALNSLNRKAHSA